MHGWLVRNQVSGLEEQSRVDTYKGCLAVGGVLLEGCRVVEREGLEEEGGCCCRVGWRGKSGRKEKLLQRRKRRRDTGEEKKKREKKACW